MAKRSPILGYNHNVRYRGLMWHVQTEDSGLANPHLFSHLFHEGVIVSTRKLVYDSGSDEGAIKSLMQAQHKAVMKDLKRGHFDDKIDLYLHGTEGLLPRGVVEDAGDKPAAVAPPVVPATAVAPAPTLDLDALDPPTIRQDPPALPARPIMPSELEPATSVRGAVGTAPRTVTMDRTSGPSSVRSALLEADLPETASADMAAAVAAANTTMRQLAGVDSSAEIEIRLELEAEEPIDSGEPEPEYELDPSRTSSRRRAHDTEISLDHDPTRSDIPNMVVDDATRPNVASDAIPSMIAGRERSQPESIPPLPAPPERRPTGDRPAVGAASLPPARPISRPPSRAVTPQSIARPQSESDARRRHDSDSVEVHAPAPPSADTPPGMSERPGQYAQYRRVTNPIPNDIVRSDRSGGIPVAPPAIPAGLAKPRPVSGINPATGPIPRPISREQSPPPIPSHDSVPHVVRVDPASSSGPVRSRTLTPARIPLPASRPTPGGVVMTRPAVIVGAPAKPAVATRVRKAREEEGRGFGQGLISEKSLDEVILAYLSEDADEK